MSTKGRYFYILASVLAILVLIATACQPAAAPQPTEAPAAPAATEAPAAPAGEARWQKPIVIGWTPPDITGVFKTATDFFEKSAADGNRSEERRVGKEC